MARADSLAKLAWAYGLHQAGRRLRRPQSQLSTLLETYAPDGIKAITPAERQRHPHLVTCINCGLCALAASRIGKRRLPDLACSYMLLYARLGNASLAVAGDAGGYGPDMAARAR